MWVNKGFDNQSVSFNCDIGDIIKKCKQVGGYSVLRFHNHPNPDPIHYTTLLASEQDKVSANSCSEIVCKEGINWFDFVCSRGDFLQFFSKVSETFVVDGNSVSDIIDISGITPQMDYRLQAELHHIKEFKFRLKLIIPIAVLIIAICFSIGMIKQSTRYSNTKVTESTVIENPQENIEFQNAESFENALNNDQKLTGTVIVHFVPREIHPDSALGYNIWAGEHLNFLSDEDPGIKLGDNVIVTITKITSGMDSWFIRYNIISINGIPYSQ